MTSVVSRLCVRGEYILVHFTLSFRFPFVSLLKLTAFTVIKK